MHWLNTTTWPMQAFGSAGVALNVHAGANVALKYNVALNSKTASGEGVAAFLRQRASEIRKAEAHRQDKIAFK